MWRGLPYPRYCLLVQPIAELTLRGGRESHANLPMHQPGPRSRPLPVGRDGSLVSGQDAYGIHSSAVWIGVVA